MLIQDTGTPSCRSCPITLSPSVLDMMLRIKLLTGKCVTRAAKLSLPFQCFERQRMDAVVTLYSMTMASILRLSLKLNAHPVHCTLELSACMEIFKVQQANLFLWAEEHADLPFLIWCGLWPYFSIVHNATIFVHTTYLFTVRHTTYPFTVMHTTDRFTAVDKTYPFTVAFFLWFCTFIFICHVTFIGIRVIGQLFPLQTKPIKNNGCQMQGKGRLM